MEKLVDMYNYAKLAVAMELVLFGCMEEFHLGTVIVLGMMLLLTGGTVLFLRRAIVVYRERTKTRKVNAAFTDNKAA